MADKIATAYVLLEPTFKGIQEKIGKELDSSGAGEKSGKEAGSNFSQGFASVVGSTAKVVAGAVAAGSAAVAGVVKESTANFAEYEQLIGGVETLFGSSYDSIEEFIEATGFGADEAASAWEQYQNRQQTVLDNAANAYATAGMSANEYMNTVNGFAAALNNSLGEYAWQSANYADMAVGDMADNANKMGTSMEAVQNAYAGFSKGNFTMLDNLKLGYGGTKTEMERLMRDAEQMEGLIEGSLSVDSFADVVDAIHIVQENMGITGTTANEASTTIQGSLAALQASWTNVLTGMGDKNSDMSALIGTLVENAETYIGNMLPVIEQALTGVTTLIAELAPVIASELPALLQTVLPMLLTSGAQVIQTLAQGILDSIPAMLPMITQLVVDLGTMIVQMLPQLIQVGAQVLLSLATGIAEALPSLIPTIVEVILTITDYLIENIDLLIDASIQIITGLAMGLIQALPILIEKAPVIILKFMEAIATNAPKLVESAFKLITTLASGLMTYLPTLVAKVPLLIAGLITAFNNMVNKFIQVGKNIIEGIKKGISDAWDSLVKWFTDKIGGLVDGVKDIFKIGSPSKVFEKEVGQWIPAGIAKGIEDGMGVLDKAMEGMSTNVIAKGIESTVSNTIESGTMQDAGSSADLYVLLAQALPRIMDLIAEDKSIEIDGQAVFRAMQRQSRHNTQLVGPDAVLSAI